MGGLPRLNNSSTCAAGAEEEGCLSRSRQRLQRILQRGPILLYLSFALMTFTLNMVFFSKINAGRSDIHANISDAPVFENSDAPILKDNTLQTHLDNLNQIDRTNRSNAKEFNTNKSWWRGRQADNQLNSTDFTRNGARHPNGTLGMIVDPSPERLHLPLDDPTKNPLFCPPPASSSLGVDSSSLSSSPVSFEGAAANIVLQKIRKGILNSRAFLQDQLMDDSKVEHDKGLRAAAENTTSTQQRRRRSRILCMVYTVYIPGENNHSNVRSQAETWGRQCDGFIAASNFTDHSVGAIDLVHNGPEEYGNMWQKTRSMLAYAYQHYLDEFDFFNLCGDDVYIYMDNLRAYLDGPEVSKLENGYIDKISSGFQNSALFNKNNAEYIIGFKNYAELNAAIKKWSSTRPRPLLLGSPFSHKGMPMISGGTGYTLNRAALRVFSERSLAHVFPNAHDSREDMYLGGALAEQGIFVSDTKDVNDGDRYGGSATSTYNFKGISPAGIKWLKHYFGLKYKKGIDSISEQFISSHLKDSKMEMIEINRTIPELMRRYHVILNDLCEHGYR
jgi:hypothetical protein